MLSGDRDGSLFLHDLSTGGVLRSLKHGSTNGHVTCVSHAGGASADGEGTALMGSRSGGESGSGGAFPGAEHTFFSGGQDGCVRVWDARSEACVANLKLHTSSRGTGALADIVVPCSGAGAHCPLLVTAAADRRICVVEARQSFGRSVGRGVCRLLQSALVWC